MNNAKFYWTSLIFGGLILSIGIALGGKFQGNLFFSRGYWVVWILTAILWVARAGFRVGKKFKNQQNEQLDLNQKFVSLPTYRIERYVRRWWKYEDPIDTNLLELIDLRGRRSQDPDERLRQVIEKWEWVKQQPNGVFLEEFLASEFGVTNGVLNVSKSKFYTRRRKLRETTKKNHKSKVHEDAKNAHLN